MALAWASAGFSQQSVPSGTEEALCKGVSNEERKALQVEVLGGPLVEVCTSLGRSEWPAWCRGGCGQHTAGWRGGEETGRNWLHVSPVSRTSEKLLSEVKHRSTFYPFLKM